MKKNKVVVALSGGVDSSVAAYLLKEQGHDLIGLFMKNWHDENVTISDECPWLDDSNDAMLVAEKLKIPFQTVDLSKEYKEKIIDYMFDEYSKGNTPNPDILCNKEIKFDVFMDIALSLGAMGGLKIVICDTKIIPEPPQYVLEHFGKEWSFNF